MPTSGSVMLLSDRSTGHVLVGLCVGLIAGSLVALTHSVEPKLGIPLVLAVVFTAVIAAIRIPDEWCARALLLSMPLPMHAFLVKLSPVHGGGALGLYFVAADLPLLLLYGLWFLDRIKGIRPPVGRPNTFVLLLAPFLLVGTISIVYSPRPIWALVEVVRWLKVGAVLLYVSKKLPERALPGCIWAIGFSIVLESGLGLAQMATRSNLGLDRFGFFGAAGEQAVTQELSSAEILFRGSALTGHPNYLAGYLLLVTPVFLLITIGSRSRSERWFGFVVFMTGAAGLLSTMSRAAWVAFIGACVFGFVSAAAFGLLTFRRALVVLLAAVVAGAAGTLGLSDLVQKRFQSDFRESWQLRADLNQAALDIARDHPLGGVGLNNYTVVYPDYDPAFAEQMEEIDGSLTVVHNLYALLLAEVGFVGLSSFLALFIGVFIVVARAMPQMPARHRPLAVGIVSGIVGALAFDLTEFSLWVDGSMYTLAFLIGLVAIIVSPTWRVRPRERAARLQSVL